MISSNKPGFQTDINGLRGISVLLVVLYHLNVSLFKGGFVGVDIFFVISGYLMTKIIVSGMLQNKFSYIDFLIKRALRIFPALFFLIAALLIIGVFAFTPSDFKSLADQSIQAVIFNSNNYFANKQGYFTAGADDRWLLHTWSLSVEWQFYMLYPALISLCVYVVKINNSKNIINLKSLLFLFLLASFTYCIFSDPQSAFFSVLTRAWQMIAGGFVYLSLTETLEPRKHNAYLSYAGLLIIALSVVLVKRYNLEAIWPGYFAIMPVAGACTLLLGNYNNNIVLNNRVIQTLGKWSYSIYLWHWPLIVGFSMAGILTNHPKMVWLFISIILGCMSYTFVESSKLFNSSSKKLVIAKLSGLGALLIFFSYAIWLSNGWIGRTNDHTLFENLEIAENSNTYNPGCENRGTKSDKFCVINEKLAGKKILLIGDSHAGHLYPWFLKHSKVNTTFYIKSGCPLIMGFERVDQNKACRDYSKKAYALAESGRFQTVIISQNWVGFSNKSETICSFENGKCISPARSINPQLPLQQMETTIKGILRKNVNVAIVDSTPWFIDNVPKKIGRDMFWHGSTRSVYSSEQFFKDSEEFDSVFNKLKEFNGFSVLSLRQKICGGSVCRTFDEKEHQPIFKDHDHFNPSWLENNGGVFSKVSS